MGDEILTLILLCLSSCIRSLNGAPIVHVEGFPWMTEDLNDRQDELLDAMREKMSLVMNEEIVPPELLATSGQMYLRNVQGELFSVVSNLATLKKNAPLKSLPRELVDARAFSHALADSCSILPDAYWNVEWCHRQDIRQFHVEMAKGKAIRSPDYSLGVYQRSAVMREGGDSSNTSARILKIVDYFGGGQHCDETGMPRNSEVHLQCCEGLKVNDVKPLTEQQNMNLHLAPGSQGSRGRSGKKGTTPQATLKGFGEPNVCSYQLIVCVPLLCPKRPVDAELDGLHAMQRAGPAGTPRAMKTLLEVMKDLSVLCLGRQEEWWTYELCFGKGIRQFHVHVDVAKDDKGVLTQKQVISNEFDLGKAPIDVYSDGSQLEKLVQDNRKDSLVHSTAPQHTHHHYVGGVLKDETPPGFRPEAAGMPAPVLLGRGRESPKSLKIEFTGGTPCDIENTMRATTAELFCGPKDAIVDIVEDKTCHYHFKVHSTALCAVPELAPKVKKVKQVEFVPVDNDDSPVVEVQPGVEGESEVEVEDQVEDEFEVEGVAEDYYH